MENKKKKGNTTFMKVLKVILRVLLLVFLSFAIFVVFYLPRTSYYTQEIADKYSAKVFPKISYVFICISNYFQFSLTEVIAVVGSITFLAFVIYVIVMMIVRIIKGGFFKYIYKVVSILLVLVLVFGLVFQLMHGLNYRRTSVENKLNLTDKERILEEILPVYTWARDEMIAAREKLGKDENGVVHMMTNFDESVYYANILVNSASQYLNLELSDNYTRAKAVSLSHYWAYTNILGMYDPFLGEANINVDCTLPQIYAETIVHEVLHTRGLARESDAELAAVLICCMADRADFRYAGFYQIYTNLSCVLRDYGIEVPYDEGAYKDTLAWIAYNNSLVDNKVTRVVSDVSEKTNDNFLKSNDQEGGTDTYIVNNNYYVEFYYNYISASVEND